MFLQSKPYSLGVFITAKAKGRTPLVIQARTASRQSWLRDGKRRDNLISGSSEELLNSDAVQCAYLGG